MGYLPKVLIANVMLFSAATLLADYNSQYSAPIHHDGRMPDGSMVYEQSMQSRPPNQNWIYDPAVSAQWRPSNNLPQGEPYEPSNPGSTTYQQNPSYQSPGSDRPLNWSSDRDMRSYDQR